MIADFEEATAQINNRPAKGRERESLIINTFLNKYLPATVHAVHGAEILDSLGNRSAECDIVIQDANTPPLYVGDTFHLIPVEWAHGIVEVKSQLTTVELEDAHAKILRAKSLKKLTYVPQTGDIRWGHTVYGERFDFFPMYGIVFAYRGNQIADLCNSLWELQRETPIANWIDAVVVLNQGVLLYSDPAGGFASRPEPGCTLHAITSDVSLVPGTLAIQTAFGAAWMPPAKLGPYIGAEPWGDIVSAAGPL
jgi:hypothetical protein